MKKLIVLLLLCTMLATMGGCHGSKGLAAFEIPAEFDTSRQYEITFWAKNDTNKTQSQIYVDAIESFQKLYPNIKVNIRLYTDYGRIYNDVITNIATNTTPNVCITYPDHIATYLTGINTVVPLDELLTDGRYGLGGSEVRFDSPRKDEVILKFLNEGIIDGHYYAIPYMRSTEACYINKTYVEKLGFKLPEKLTWDFVWEVADAAAQKDEEGNYKVNGQKVMIPFIYKSTDNMMIQMLRQKNAGYSTAEGDINIFNDVTSELLLNIADHVRLGAFSTFKISSYPANFLNAGQCIFAIDSTAGSTWMGSNAPLLDISEENLVQFETAVMPIPQFDPEHPQMISQGPSICVFNKKDPQEVMAAWLFAQYLLTNDVQIAYAETEGYVPVTQKARQSAEYQQYLSLKGTDNNEHYDIKIEATELLMNNTDNTFVTPVFNGSASLRDAAGQLIENVTKSIRRGETVDRNYLDNMYQDVISLYRLDQINRESAEKHEFPPLDTTAVILLGSLAVVWTGLGITYVASVIRSRRKEN